MNFLNFANYQINEKEKKYKKAILKKLFVAVVITVVMLVGVYFSYLYDIAKFTSAIKKLVYVSGLVVAFLLSYVALNCHLEFDVNKKHYKKYYQIYDFIQFLILTILIVFFVQIFIFKVATIEGASMEPNFYNGDIVFVSQYKKEFERDDVVVINPSKYKYITLDSYNLLLSDEKEEYYVKRIKAVPGDKIKIETDPNTLNHYLYINDSLIQEISVRYKGLKNLIEEIGGVIPKGKYFLLGDNRENSKDSRVFGLVDQEDILGEVFFKLKGKGGLFK